MVELVPRFVGVFFRGMLAAEPTAPFVGYTPVPQVIYKDVYDR